MSSMGIHRGGRLVAMRRDGVGSHMDGAAALTERETERGVLNISGPFQPHLLWRQQTVAARLSRSEAQEYRARVKIRGRDSGTMSSASIVVVRQDRRVAEIKGAGVGGGG